MTALQHPVRSLDVVPLHSVPRFPLTLDHLSGWVTGNKRDALKVDLDTSALPHPYVRIDADSIYQTILHIPFGEQRSDHMWTHEITPAMLQAHLKLQMPAESKFELHGTWPVVPLYLGLMGYDLRGVRTSAFLQIASTRPTGSGARNWVDQCASYPSNTAANVPRAGSAVLQRDSLKDGLDTPLFVYDVDHMARPGTRIMMTFDFDKMAAQLPTFEVRSAQEDARRTSMVAWNARTGDAAPLRDVAYFVAHDLPNVMHSGDVFKSALVSHEMRGPTWHVSTANLKSELERARQQVAQADHCLWSKANLRFTLCPAGPSAKWDVTPGSQPPELQVRMIWALNPSSDLPMTV